MLKKRGKRLIIVTLVFLSIIASIFCLFGLLLAAADSAAEDENDFTIKPNYEYRHNIGRDPFRGFDRVQDVDILKKVDISSLVLSGISKIDGEYAAIFRNRTGETYGYMLVGGKLLGQNDIPIEGITGEVKDERSVQLKQGDKEIVFTLPEELVPTIIKPTEAVEQ